MGGCRVATARHGRGETCDMEHSMLSHGLSPSLKSVLGTGSDLCLTGR